MKKSITFGELPVGAVFYTPKAANYLAFCIFNKHSASEAYWSGFIPNNRYGGRFMMQYQGRKFNFNNDDVVEIESSTLPDMPIVAAAVSSDLKRWGVGAAQLDQLFNLIRSSIE